MRITKLRLAVMIVLVVAGAATPWLLQRRSEITLREKINALQAQLDQLNQQRTEDSRPSDSPAAAGTSLPNDQLRELLKLRGEVGLLRKQTNELLRLQTEIRRAPSDPASGKSQQGPNLAGGDLVRVESLAFAGYATPEAAFQSTLSADAKGDLKTFLEGFTPERRQMQEQGITGKSERERAERAAHFAAANVRILDSRLLSEDEAELTVFLGLEKENDLTTLTMKKIGGDWKISGTKH